MPDDDGGLARAVVQARDTVRELAVRQFAVRRRAEEEGAAAGIADDRVADAVLDKRRSGTAAVLVLLGEHDATSAWVDHLHVGDLGPVVMEEDPVLPLAAAGALQTQAENAGVALGRTAPGPGEGREDRLVVGFLDDHRPAAFEHRVGRDIERVADRVGPRPEPHARAFGAVERRPQRRGVVPLPIADSPELLRPQHGVTQAAAAFGSAAGTAPISLSASRTLKHKQPAALALRTA